MKEKMRPELTNSKRLTEVEGNPENFLEKTSDEPHSADNRCKQKP